MYYSIHTIHFVNAMGCNILGWAVKDVFCLHLNAFQLRLAVDGRFKKSFLGLCPELGPPTLHNFMPFLGNLQWSLKL